MDDEHAIYKCCQIKSIYEVIDDFTSDINILDRIFLFSLNLKLTILRKLKKIYLILVRKNSDNFIVNSNIDNQIFKIVRKIFPKKQVKVQIRSFEEIVNLLDKYNKTNKLEFVQSMQKYCGTTRKIKKNVKYFFDERAWKMRKCKNIILLDNCICSGEDIFSEGTCDRSCFFFWDRSWLKF
jgi:hypothetical protein